MMLPLNSSQASTETNNEIKYSYIYTQGTSLHIDAPKGYEFTNVEWADFGEPYFDPNDGEYYSYPDCSTPFTTPEKLFDIVVGKTSVDIAADPNIYGNPCPQYQQNLGYTIVASPITLTPDPTQTPEPTPTFTPTPTSTPIVMPTAIPTAIPTPTKKPIPKNNNINAIFNLGMDMTDKERKDVQRVIIPTIIVGQIMVMSRRRK